MFFQPRIVPSIPQRMTPLLEQVPRQAHVLVVDDDPASAHYVAARVRELGHRTTEATTWIEAVRAFSSDVDLVLMDAVMPTVDGFKLTKILRQRAHSYVPIVFLTGLADSAAQQRGIACGADDFLIKPVGMLELGVRMTAMLRIRELTRELENKSRALEKLARIDPLTGVANRRDLEQTLESEVARAVRYGHPLSVIMVDVDHFKLVNDNFGHAVGDEILCMLGKLLTRCTRTTDRCYRYGGEEFVVLAPETPTDAAVILADRIREAFAAESPAASEAGKQTLSAGVACTHQFDGAITPANLLGAADLALYQAKADGRNRVCLCHDVRQFSAA